MTILWDYEALPNNVWLQDSDSLLSAVLSS